LKPEDYGLMGMAMIFIGFMDLFNDVGLGAAIIQKKESTLGHQELSSVFWISLFVGFAIYTTIFIVAPFAADFFREAKLSRMIRFLGIGFIIGSLRLLPYNLLTKALQFKRRGFAEFVSVSLSSIVCLAAALSGLGVWSLVLGYLAKEIVLTTMTYALKSFRPDFYFSWKSIRQLFSFGLNVTLSRVLWYFYSNVDYLIIGRFFGKIPLGYYSVAFQLSSMPVTKINQLTREITFPVYSYIQEDKKKLGYYFLKNIRLVSLILFPVLTGLSVIAYDFFSVILGEKWLPSVTLFQILCVSCAFRAILTQHAPVLNAVGRPDINAKYNLSLALVMPLAFIFMSRYGIIYIVVTWVTLYPLLGLYTVFQTIRILSLSVNSYMRALVAPLIGCIIMVLLTSIFQSTVTTSSIVRLFGTCLVGSLTYPAVIWVISRETFRELKSIWALLKPEPVPGKI
jgi:O-antigen/teichoic acid export membrane protein